MEVIEQIIVAIIPVFIFMALGAGLRQKKFFDDSAWLSLEKLIYYILFPALTIYSLADVSFNNVNFLYVAIALNVAQLVMFFISFAAWFQKGMTGPKFTSIVQNNIRWNSYIAIGIAKTVYPDYLSVVILAVAAMIPVANILSVWALLIWGKFENGDKPDAFSDLFTNPFVISCIIGLVLQYFEIKLPYPITHSLKLLGIAAIPLGIMAIGAGLDMQNLKVTSHERISWSIIRLIAYPMLALISCHIFGITEPHFILMSMLATAAPTASNGYILARQMGGDAPFMAALVGTTTLFSAFTIPLVIWMFNYTQH